jgi:2-deoxy-D-gluconate 3-dehydrogenase
MNPMKLFDLSGRAAVVTGGNGGIGRSLALGCAAAGASVAIVGRNEEKNQHVLGELQEVGNPAMALRLDLTQRDQIEPALQEIERQLGPVDILINNAGIASLSGGILEESAEDWDRVIETQLNAVFLFSKFAAQSMTKRKAGKIINLGSMYSYFGSAVIPSYSAAKGAIVQLTKSMAIELAPYNIQVNAIAPGWFVTEMTAAVRTPELKEMNDEILLRTPAGRWGETDELIGTAIFLASGASDFVTGALIPVDGGYSIR